MNNKIHDTFDQIHAEAALKEKTLNFLHEKIQQKSINRNIVRFRRAAACLSFVLVFVIGGFSHHLYFISSAYVDLDVNPSVALAINPFGRVIEANPYNDDGAAILQEVDVRHMNYRNATDQLIGAMVAKGYLQQDGLVSVTVQAEDENKGNNMRDRLQSTIDQTLQAHHTSAATSVFPVSGDVRNHAHENHVTPAKYLAISALQQVDPTASFADCREKTIGEINQRTQEHGGGHGNDGLSDDGCKSQEDNRGHGGKHHEHP